MLLMGAFDKILVKLKIHVDLNPPGPFLDILDKLIRVIKSCLFLLLIGKTGKQRKC